MVRYVVSIRLPHPEVDGLHQPTYRLAHFHPHDKSYGGVLISTLAGRWLKKRCMIFVLWVTPNNLFHIYGNRFFLFVTTAVTVSKINEKTCTHFKTYVIGRVFYTFAYLWRRNQKKTPSEEIRCIYELLPSVISPFMFAVLFLAFIMFCEHVVFTISAICRTVSCFCCVLRACGFHNLSRTTWTFTNRSLFFTHPPSPCKAAF